MSELARISISLEKNLLDSFDAYVARNGYPTRSEALKALMRKGLTEQDLSRNGVVAGAITIMYDHHRPGVARKLMEIQHDLGSVIVSTQHVHLDHDHCLEIVVVKGRASRIQSLVNAMKTVKGLKHNSTVMTSVGDALG